MIMPINRTALIIIWQQQALSHHRLRDDVEISSVQRRIHREAARIYSECADELFSLVKNEAKKEEQDTKEVEG